MVEFVLALVFTHSFAVGAALAKSACSARELRGQDCRLTAGTYTVRLLNATVERDDGTWHTVDPMPLKGEGVTWEKVKFEVQHGIPLLQIWIWDAGKGQALVQDLHWFTTDARKGALKILAEGVVRRRRLKPQEEIPVVPNPKKGAKVPEKKKPEFLYDGWEKHSAKISKNAHVDWELGPLKKNLDPEAPVPVHHEEEEERKGH